MNEKKKRINKISKFENKHKIISFLIVLILTIVISRLITFLIDPNLTIASFELHHFHYGLILLIIMGILMLYQRGKFEINLILTAIAIGLIIDELYFISGKIRGPITYSSTLTSVIIIGIILALVIEFIYYKIEKRKLK